MMRIEWQRETRKSEWNAVDTSKRIWINCNCHYRHHCMCVCENPGKLVRTHSTTHLNTHKRSMKQTRYKCSHCTQSFWQISIELLFYRMTAHRNYNFQFISNVPWVSRRRICIRQAKDFRTGIHGSKVCILLEKCTDTRVKRLYSFVLEFDHCMRKCTQISPITSPFDQTGTVLCKYTMWSDQLLEMWSTANFISFGLNDKSKQILSNELYPEMHPNLKCVRDYFSIWFALFAFILFCFVSFLYVCLRVCFLFLSLLLDSFDVCRFINSFVSIKEATNCEWKENPIQIDIISCVVCGI